MYGVTQVHKANNAPPAVPGEAAVVVSSQEIPDSQDSIVDSVVVPQTHIEWVDVGGAVPIRWRLLSNGTKEQVELKAGSSGFGIASFSDGDVVTEVPNEMLSQIVRKKPAASKKVPTTPKIKKACKEKPDVDVAKDSGCEEVSEGPPGIEVSDVDDILQAVVQAFERIRHPPEDLGEKADLLDWRWGRKNIKSEASCNR